MPPTCIALPHLPPTHPLYITAYTSVSNTPHLHSQLLASNQAYNYTFLDARTILSTTHLLSACFRALTDHLHSRLKSNNVHAEIVFGFSGNNNIGEAFRRFGIGDGGCSEVVVVRIGSGGEGEEEMVGRELEGKVEGAEVEFGGEGKGLDEWLARVCDLDVVRRNYKIAKPAAKKMGAVNEAIEGDEAASERRNKERERRELERVVLGIMALRGAS